MGWPGKSSRCVVPLSLNIHLDRAARLACTNCFAHRMLLVVRLRLHVVRVGHLARSSELRPSSSSSEAQARCLRILRSLVEYVKMRDSKLMAANPDSLRRSMTIFCVVPTKHFNITKSPEAGMWRRELTHPRNSRVRTFHPTAASCPAGPRTSQFSSMFRFEPESHW